MKKSGIAMLALLFNVAQQSTATDVKATMYVDTEMPCLSGERLSGRIVIRNNGDDEIKLMGRPDFLEKLAYFQLYIFPDVSVEEEERMTARPAESPFLRARIKNHMDSDVSKNRDIVTLKKGDNLEVVFEGIELKVPHSTSQVTPFVVELYLSPDTWLPVEVHPPIEAAFDAKHTLVTTTEKGDNSTARVSRVRIGTNEFLWAKANSSSQSQRLADLHPDDAVVHTNKTITITRKDGDVRTIPEADIPRVSAERKEERRKKAEEGK